MKNQRPGFTLVELLVVITIIGILMGLLIPAVNAARETARRNQCASQLNNLALASYQYTMKQNRTPGWVQDYGYFAAAPDPADSGALASNVTAHRKVGTWAVSLLSDLDAQPTYERWTQDRYPIITLDSATTPGTIFTPSNGSIDGNGFHPEAAPNLAIFQCPSNSVNAASFGKNSYVINAGMADYRTAVAANGGPTGSGTAATIATLAESMDRSNGATTNGYDGNSGVLGPDMRFEDFKDGQSSTMLFTENVQAMPWHRAGFLHGTGATNPLTTVVATAPFHLNTSANATLLAALHASRYTTGAVWHFEDEKYVQLNAIVPPPTSPSGAAVINVYKKHKVNGAGNSVSEDIQVEQISSTNYWDLARPSSLHPGGVNIVMVDRTTKFLAETVDYRVFQALLTSRGKSSDVPWPEYILDPEAL